MTEQTGKSFEVLSRDTVKQLQDQFVNGIEAKAKKAVPPAADNAQIIVDSLKVLLVEMARKAIDAKDEELKELAAQGKDAIVSRAKEVENQIHTRNPSSTSYPSPTFSDDQKETIARAASRRKELKAADEAFGDEDRIYLRLTGDVQAPPSETQQRIATYLQEKGYTITDYTKGYATDEKGKQQFRIGKLLKDAGELYQAFMDDSSRSSPSLIAVISRKPEDIARVSTGRAWSSCMGSGGFNWNYVPKDISEGSLVAYLVSEKDPDIINPLARILIKPFHEDHGKLSWLASLARKVFPAKEQDPREIFVPDNSYGLHNDTFKTVVKDFVEERLNRTKDGKFRLAGGLYADGVSTRIKRSNGVNRSNYN